MSKLSLRLLFFTLLAGTIVPGTPSSGGLALAQEDTVYEVGGTVSLPDTESIAYQDPGSLNTRLELAAQYTSFTGDDMNETYAGLPTVAIGISFQTGRRARTFVSRRRSRRPQWLSQSHGHRYPLLHDDDGSRDRYWCAGRRRMSPCGPRNSA